jgi:hypothetical protein
MLSDEFVERALLISEGSLSPTIKWKRLAEQEFTIPPLDRQREIVDIMSASGRAVSSSREVLRHVDLLLTAAAVGRLSEQTTIELGSIAQIDAGLALSPDRRNAAELHPYLRVENLATGHLDLSDVKSMGATGREVEALGLRAGDILAVGDNANPARVGLPVLLGSDLRGHVFQNHVLRVRSRDRHVVPPISLHAVMLGLHRSGSLRAHATGTSIKHLKLSVLRSIPIPDIRNEEHDEFAALGQLLATARGHQAASERVAWSLSRKLLSA